MERILYVGTKNASSWSLRAWLALREQGIAFEERLVDIRQPARPAELARVRAFSPPGAVPVLVEGDHVIFDSLATMEYASELGERPLLPDDRMRRASSPRGATSSLAMVGRISWATSRSPTWRSFRQSGVWSHTASRSTASRMSRRGPIV
jgi:glutathione S-transferase